MKLSLRLVVFLFSFFIISCSDLITKDNHVKPEAHQANTQMDDEVHALLREEMQAIQTGMMSLVPAIASGNWEEIAAIGKNIEESYILKQQLSLEQRHALHQSLPTGFIKRDQAFRHSAGMLAHAAEMGNADIVNFYFYKLTSACVECHTEFAHERFHNLAPQASETHHH